MIRYKLPTKNQILFLWDVKPTAKVVGLIIQDWANEEMGSISDKAYNHMPQAERKEFDRDQLKKARITVSIRKLADSRMQVAAVSMPLSMNSKKRDLSKAIVRRRAKA